MVEAEGIPAYMVHVKVRPKTGKWPEINQVLPVVLDRGNPARVEIVWDQVQSRQDRVQLRGRRDGSTMPGKLWPAARRRTLRQVTARRRT